MTDVQNVVQTGIGQAPVSTVYVGERTYPLTVRFDEAARASAVAIGNLPVTTTSGAQVPPGSGGRGARAHGGRAP